MDVAGWPAVCCLLPLQLDKEAHLSLCGAHGECFQSNTCCWPPQRRLSPVRLLCVLQARLEGIAAELRELLPNLNVGALHGLPGVGGQWGMADLSNTFTALSTAACCLACMATAKNNTQSANIIGLQRHCPLPPADLLVEHNPAMLDVPGLKAAIEEARRIMPGLDVQKQVRWWWFDGA